MDKKELVDFLKSFVNNDQIIFGQQHATDAGLTLNNEEKKPGHLNSDVKILTGNNPGIFGWDAYLSIMSYEAPGVIGDEKQSIINLAESMNTVHNAGGILVLSMHPYNFVTGKNFYDVSGNVVHKILTGGTAQKRFIHWLNGVIRLDHLLKDKCGHQYAIIFRPFHEQTGNWFWWGKDATAPEDYKKIYRFLVDYLRQN